MEKPIQRLRSSLIRNIDWSQAAGAGVGVLGNLFGGFFNANQQAKTRKWQTREREASQAFQTSEREAQQAFQTSEREAQNQASLDAYFQTESPMAQVAQLKSAGLNPAIAADNPGSSSISGGSSGGAPSSSAPSAPSGSAFQMPMDSFSSGFQSVASAVKSLADARKAGVDTDITKSMAQWLIKDAQFSALAKEFMYSLDTQNLPQKQALELKTLANAIASGNIEISKLQEELNGLVQQNRITRMQADTFMDNFKANLANIQSSTESNLSNVRFNDKQIEFLDYRIDDILSIISNRFEDTRGKKWTNDFNDEFRDKLGEKLAHEVEGMDYDNAIRYLNAVAQEMKNINLEVYGEETIDAGRAISDAMRDLKSTRHRSWFNQSSVPQYSGSDGHNHRRDFNKTTPNHVKGSNKRKYGGASGSW